jgi:hypothetical protein
VSSSPNEVTPHIFIRTSHLQPANFAIDHAKRLLQQYRATAGLLGQVNSGAEITSRLGSKRSSIFLRKNRRAISKLMNVANREIQRH